jgi:hypothetical protein
MRSIADDLRRESAQQVSRLTAVGRVPSPPFFPNTASPTP